MMLTRVGISLICIGPWQASIWASSLKISWAREATTGSGVRKHKLWRQIHRCLSQKGKLQISRHVTEIAFTWSSNYMAISFSHTKENKSCTGNEILQVVLPTYTFSILTEGGKCAVHCSRSNQFCISCRGPNNMQPEPEPAFPVLDHSLSQSHRDHFLYQGVQRSSLFCGQWDS